MVKVHTTSNDVWWEAGKAKAPELKSEIMTMTLKTEYKGDMEGLSVAHFSMMAIPGTKLGDGCTEDGNNLNYAGISVFEGSVLGKKGTFTIRLTGHNTDGYSNCTIAIIPGTGTEQLKGITGKGVYRLKLTDLKNAPLTLDIEFE